MTTHFKPGDIVNVFIKGVRVSHQSADGSITILDEDNRCHTMPPQAAIERITPAEWPPQPGDVWADENPFCRHWFAQRSLGDGNRIVMVPVDGGPDGMTTWTPDDVLKSAVDLTLAYRPEVAW